MENEATFIFEAEDFLMKTIKNFGLGYANQYPDDLYRFFAAKGFSDAQLKDSGLVKIDERGCYDKFWNRVMFPIMVIITR